MQTLGTLASGHFYNPRDVPNVFLSWDASVSSSVTDAGAGAVSLWHDWRLAGPHQVGASGSARPTTGTRTVNSLNAIDFDGTDDNLAGGFDVWTQAQPFTIWIVLESDDGANAARQTVLDRGSTTGISMGKNASDEWFMNAGSEIAGATTVDTDPHVLTAIYNGASSVLRLDGTQIQSGNAGTNGYSAHSIRLGQKANGSEFWDGAIAEVIMATGVATAAILSATDSYLISKWGI